MSHHEAHGISVELPPGWNGMIYRRREQDGAGGVESASAEGPPAESGAILRAATVPLDAGDGDFGGGVVQRLGALDAFFTLFEYTVDEHLKPGVGLFEERGVPWPLKASQFRPEALQVALPGQAGVQRFFTAQDRPFCLYVVAGSLPLLATGVRSINGILASIAIAPGRP